MHRFTTGWFRPKARKTKPMSFLIVLYCPDCGRLFSASRAGLNCPECASGSTVRASDWDLEETGVGKLHMGKVKAK